jgi:UDP-N-acetylglucosamine 2-epimerase (non-hydrolysing)
MITCLIGTRAQLIKMAPVLLETERRQLPLRFVLTGQHKETMTKMVRDFGIHTEPHYIYRGKEITGILAMSVWFGICLMKCWWHRGIFLPYTTPGPNVMLIHGDTFSTLLGAILGKLRGLKVFHVEAGLRSHNIMHPFPEELTRLMVFTLSDVSFCPGAWAHDNMRHYRAKAIDTGHNTLIDALTIAFNNASAPQNITVAAGYGVVSLHRFENIFNPARLKHICDMLSRAAATHPLVFVLHPATHKALIRHHQLSRLKNHPGITLLPRMGYFEFIGLLVKARFVITDGGSNQEELSYMGVPTLLMRKATERKEGLGDTVRLCNYDEGILDDFLRQLPDPAVRHIDRRLKFDQTRPTDIIVDYLESMPQ